MLITLDNVEAYVRDKYKDTPPGIYDIGTGDWHCFTGAAGAIYFEVELWRRAIELYGPFNVD